jgi:hypothetical protein
MGRKVSITATGATVRELEADAFRKARKFFGEQARLEIAYEYTASQYPPGTDNFRANVTIARRDACPDSRDGSRPEVLLAQALLRLLRRQGR